MKLYSIKRNFLDGTAPVTIISGLSLERALEHARQTNQSSLPGEIKGSRDFFDVVILEVIK